MFQCSSVIACLLCDNLRARMSLCWHCPSHCTLGWFIPGSGEGLPETQEMREYLKRNEKRSHWVIYREGYQSTKNLWGIKGRNEDGEPLISAVFYSSRRIRNALIARSAGHLGATGTPGFEQRKRDCSLPESCLWFLWGLAAEERLQSKWRVVTSTQANTQQWCMF